MTTTAATAAGKGQTLSHHRSAGLDITTTEGRDLREFHFTVRPLPEERPAETMRRLAATLKDCGAVVVRHEIFGSLSAHRETLEALQAAGSMDWPVTFVEGASCDGQPLSGSHVMAVAGVPVETLSLHGRPVGRSFGDKSARYLLLGDVRSDDVTLSRAEQARHAYENLDAVLRQRGLTMANVARTWLFLDDILSWYGPLNDVRTRFYQERNVFDGLVPASTGVSGRNQAGAAVVMGACAVERLNGAFSMHEVASPKQCAATQYGSSFSRAVEIATPGLRRLLVSGTASIEPGGKSVCGGDVEAQIDLTMEVVRAILVSRGMDFPDASRVTAYFKYSQDVKFFERWRAERNLNDWPVIQTCADICRDELLFEIELDALSASGLNH